MTDDAVDRGDDVQPKAYRCRKRVRNLPAVRTNDADVFLIAATAGWGPTVRYALLMLVQRGTVPMLCWMTYEIARRFGWI